MPINPRIAQRITALEASLAAEQQRADLELMRETAEIAREKILAILRGEIPIPDGSQSPADPESPARKQLADRLSEMGERLRAAHPGLGRRVNESEE